MDIVKDSMVVASDVHENLNVHSICSDYGASGAELKSVQDEFCKLRSTYLEYQTHQRFMEFMRNEDIIVSSESVDENIATSKEKMKVVQQKSSELATKVQQMMTKIRSASRKLASNTEHLDSIENIASKIEDMENSLEKMEQEKERAPLALLLMQKNRQGNEGGEAEGDSTKFCHRKAVEIQHAAEQRTKESSKTRSRVDRLRKTVTSLEDQVNALRNQLKDGDSALKRQRSTLAASKKIESEKSAILESSRKSSAKASEELERNRMETARLAHEMEDMKTMGDVKRQKMNATLSLLEQVHGFKVEAAAKAEGESEPSVKMGLRLGSGDTKGPLLTMIVTKDKGIISRVVRLEDADVETSDLRVQGRDFYATDLFQLATANGFSPQMLAQQVSERYMRHRELIQELKMCTTLHDITVATKPTTTTMIVSFPFGVANGLKVTLDVPLEYPSPQAVPTVLSVQCGENYSNGADVATELLAFYRSDRPRSLTSILEKASKV
eukprot:g2441.t1